MLPISNPDTSGLFNRVKKENIILEKTFDFSLNIIEIYKELIYKKKDYVMSKQLKQGER